MGRITLKTDANERSTYVVTLGFIDAAGEAVTPDTVRWTLTNGAGVVINSRADVVATPAASVNVVLSGDDLALLAGEGMSAQRLLTVRATYTSTEGAGLPLNQEYAFALCNLAAVT